MRNLPKRLSRFARRLLLATALSSSAGLVLASEMPANIEQQTVAAFADEQRLVQSYRSSTNPGERLDYARLLARGLLKNNHNPLRSPDPQAAIEIYRSLIAIDDEVPISVVAKELAGLLIKQGGKDAAREADELRTKYVLRHEVGKKAGRIQGPDEVPLDGTATVEALKAKMATGSTEAGFLLLDKLVAQKSPEAELVRSQVLYLTNLAAAKSDSDALRYASRYIVSPDGRAHPRQALDLIELAADKGSEAAASLLDDNRSQLVRALGQEPVRELLWKMVRGGSTRAAELVALDLLEKNVFGFDEQDSRWAVEALTEIGSERADFLNAKLYYQGIYAGKDVPRAIAAMDRMLAAVRAHRADAEVTANRYSRLGLSAGLTAKYALPLYLELWREGKSSAISHIARILMNAQRSGSYSSLASLPVKADQILAGLDEAYEDGDRNAGLIKADILREGLLVKSDVPGARRIYGELLASYGDDKEFVVKVEERIAKAVRQDLDALRNYPEYYAMVAALVAKENSWAMKEYGSLLITGGPELAREERKGFELLVKALSKGYFSAGGVAAEFAVANGDPTLLKQVLEAYSSIEQREIPPESRIAIAAVDLKLKIYDKAVDLLESPEVLAIPRGRFLLARVRYESGAATSEETTRDMADVIVNYSGEASQLPGFVGVFAALPDISAAEVEPVLARLAAVADSGDRRAMELALRLRQTWPNSKELVFRRVVNWSSLFARRGRGDALTRLALTTTPRSVSKEDYLLLIDAVEEALPNLPTNGNLRMFVSKQYISGKYRRKDFEKADGLAREAALLGNSEALNAIAVNYFYGQGVQLDRERSDALFRKLAFIGSNRSTIALARSYSKGPSSRVYESRAFAYYTKAALNGSLTAMTELGRSYLAGAGIVQDEKKGVEWLVKASERDNVDAMTQLYFHYFIQNPTINNPDAEMWLDRLVQQQVPEMIVRKAVLLYSRDPQANREEVFTLLNRAEKLGSQFARRLKNAYIQQDRGDK